MANDADALERRSILRLPVTEEIVQDRVEILLGRIPRLHGIVVDFYRVDSIDRRLSIGVGGEQYALGVGEDGSGLLQELDTGHLWHPLVDQEQGNRVTAIVDLPERVEGGCAGIRAQHAVLASVLSAQV